MHVGIDGRLYTVASDGLLTTLRQSDTLPGRREGGKEDREHTIIRSLDVDNIHLDGRIEKLRG